MVNPKRLERYQIRLKKPHEKQAQLVYGTKKRTVVRAGRRSGKTTGLALKAVKRFLEGARVLYAAPTEDQLGRFWEEVRNSLQPLIDAKILYLNNGRHIIERPGTENRIRAKTAFNADMLRGDYADELILDEFQMMSEDTWATVGVPMLMDNDGNATFLYTPPSLRNKSSSLAKDKLHAAKLYKFAEANPDRWDSIHFTSHDNPHISRTALSEVMQDMTSLAYRMEILGEDIDEVVGALWTREAFNEYRKAEGYSRIVIGVDPAGSKTSGTVGIVVVGQSKDGHFYVLEDASISNASPRAWASRVIQAYYEWDADRVVWETNFGGDMVETTIRMVDSNVSGRSVVASRGKAIRAEPISALYEKKMVYHTKEMADLEDQMVMWTPDSAWSPDRLDALVWALTELAIKPNVRMVPVT